MQRPFRRARVAASAIDRIEAVSEFLVYLYSNGAIDREPYEPVPAASELEAAQSVHNGPLQRVDGLTFPVCYEVRQKDGPPMSEELAQWFAPASRP